MSDSLEIVKELVNSVKFEQEENQLLAEVCDYLVDVLSEQNYEIVELKEHVLEILISFEEIKYKLDQLSL